MRHPIIQEEEAWEDATAQILGPESELVSVSRYVGDSRIYRRNDRAAKIRSRHTKPPKGVLTLEREAQVLRTAGGQIESGTKTDWDYLLFDWAPGRTLDRFVTRLPLRRRLQILGAVAHELRHLHGAGVAHRDLRSDNVLIGDDGRVQLIDFDRGGTGRPWSQALADWLGIGGRGTVPNPYWKFALFLLVPRARPAAQRLRAIMQTRNRTLHADESDLAMLERGWQMAALSGANAPGHRVAYYAFTYRGRHFPGERPWYLRWERIKRGVDFRGKRLVELGCNMGLLSTFATIHGAASALGVDHDEKIVDAARLVGGALKGSATFERVDLVTDPTWEGRLAGANIVAAMSLMHWLPQPERVLRFLARHPEVIYEGHDPLEVERGRLRSLGFDSVAVLGDTERGRPLLYARRSGGFETAGDTAVRRGMKRRGNTS